MEATTAKKKPTKVVTRRSNGEKVTLVLENVDRQSYQVTISIPAYNAIFTFMLSERFVVLAPDGRQKIDPADKATHHVSETVYSEMAVWAFVILIDPRRVL